MAIPSGMSGMREIQRQVITQMHALNPAKRVKVDPDSLKVKEGKNITVWDFRKEENRVIVENILKVLPVPTEGIPQPSVPGVATNVVKNMMTVGLLEDIPPRMRLTDAQVRAMKDNSDPVPWDKFLMMSSTDKRDIGKATPETSQQRIQRVSKAKEEAAERKAAKAAKMAASDTLHAPGRVKRAEKAAKSVGSKTSQQRSRKANKQAGDVSVKKAASDRAMEEGGMYVAPASATPAKSARAAMPSNPYFLS